MARFAGLAHHGTMLLGKFALWNVAGQPSNMLIFRTSRDSVLEKPISSVLLEDQKKVFERAVESMTGDNSRSHRIRFALPIGPNSRVPDGVPEAIKEVESTEDGKEPQSLLEIEAQGILIYDRKTGDNIHVRAPSMFDLLVIPLLTASLDYVGTSSLRATR